MKTLLPARNRLLSLPEFEALPETVSRIFGRDFPALLTDGHMVWSPAVNLREADGEFVLTAELPGMSANDIDIDVQENVLTLSGEKKSEHEEKHPGRWHLVERSQGEFERSLTLPRTVKPESIRAEFENGVLTVHLPKHEGAKGRRIPINEK